MNTENYKTSVRNTEEVLAKAAEGGYSPAGYQVFIATAQVHAILALAEAVRMVATTINLKGITGPVPR